MDSKVYAYFEAHPKDGSIKLPDKKSIIGTPVTKTGDNGEAIVVGYVEDVVDNLIICKMNQLDFKPVSIYSEMKGEKNE